MYILYLNHSQILVHNINRFIFEIHLELQRKVEERHVACIKNTEGIIQNE